MDEINKDCLKEIIKATLFVSGDGIEVNEFSDKFGFSLEDIKQEIAKIKEELCGESGIHLIEYGNKVQLASNPKFADYIAAVLNPIREKALTKAAMQTLAIVAYKQPVTRLDIENIRGVSSDYAVQVLIEQNMIEVVGRKDVVGKPLLFGTTEEFLKRFDLESIDNLPNYEELLERIKLIKAKEEEKSDSLYRDYTLPDEEEIPDFLKDEENLQTITAESSFEEDNISLEDDDFEEDENAQDNEKQEDIVDVYEELTKSIEENQEEQTLKDAE